MQSLRLPSSSRIPACLPVLFASSALEPARFDSIRFGNRQLADSFRFVLPGWRTWCRFVSRNRAAGSRRFRFGAIRASRFDSVPRASCYSNDLAQLMEELNFYLVLHVLHLQLRSGKHPYWFQLSVASQASRMTQSFKLS